jgi:predicted protein tyrosine phosphatase
MKRVLFICSQNRLRSPTAEKIFSSHPGIEVASAGINHDAEEPLTAELIEWADLIFVMERNHRTKLSKKFRTHLKNKQITCLDIPDKYDYMDPTLIQLLRSKITPFLPRT